MRISRAPVVPLLAALALLAGCGVGSAGSSPGTVATGYALEGSAKPADITRDGSYLRTIGIDGVTLDGPRAVTRVSPGATALRKAAQRHGRDAVLLVSNYTDALGDFDEDLAHRMLATPGDRAAVVAALVAEAAPFDGLQIDLESLAVRDTRGLVAFTTELRRALPRSTSLSMAFMASGDGAGYRARGYDLVALGKQLDRAVLMAYDQHGSWSKAGPIGALPWVTKELAYFASRVPHPRVDLGVAAYGYQWGGGKDELTVAEAQELAGSRARWSVRDAEWHATLTSGRTIWWSDVRGLRQREAVARRAGVHGVAIWQIGSSGALR